MAEKRSRVSSITGMNWGLDAALFMAAIGAFLTGIYFLYDVSNGYQGGRALISLQILFSRQDWDMLHTWTGAAMIGVAVVHLLIHWKWVASMAQRVVRILFGGAKGFNRGAQGNLLVNLGIGSSFFLAAVSGVYFLYFPHGRRVAITDGRDAVTFLFTRATWDAIHTWSGVALLAAAIVHFVIHWRWVANVTKKVLLPARDKSSR